MSKKTNTGLITHATTRITRRLAVVVNALARDIADGIRDGLSRADAVDWAWAANPHATLGQIGAAIGRVRSLQIGDTASPLTRAAATIAPLLAQGASHQAAGAVLWHHLPYLSSRQIAQALKCAAAIVSREKEGIQHDQQ